MFDTVHLLTLLLVGLSLSTAEVEKYRPFQVFWQVGGCRNPSASCNTDLSLYHIQPFNTTYAIGLSSFPSFTKDGTPQNGGVPQAVNITHYKPILRAELTETLKDVPRDFSGNGMIDFEIWSPIWLENIWDVHPWYYTYHGKYNQVYSENLVRQAHPKWPEKNITEEAKRQFQTAGAALFKLALELVHELRPKMKWGYYDFPAEYYVCSPGSIILPRSQKFFCGYSHPFVGPQLVEADNGLFPVYEASVNLFPSAYLSHAPSAGENAEFVRDLVARTVTVRNELLKKTAVRRNIYPYIWNTYHSGEGLLSDADLRTAYEGAYNAGADGLVIWGGHLICENECSYLKEKAGPMVKTLVELAEECSQKHCMGHGRCANMTSTECMCLPGYKPPNCA